MNKIKDITIAFAGTVVRVALVMLCVICISNFAGKAYDFGFRIFTEEPMSNPPGRDINIVVNESDSQSDIIQMLEDKGVIRDHLLFTIQKKLSIYKKNIKPGSYTVNTSMNTDEILAVLCENEVDEDEDTTAEGEELGAVADPFAGDDTGLEAGGVLSEEGQYDESAAFQDDTEHSEGDEFVGEGDEESALED